MSSISAADTITTAPDGALAPIALGPHEGEHFWFFGGLTTIKADGAGTGGRMLLTEQTAPRGSGSPLHVHHDEDEWFYVLEGELVIWVAGQTVVAPAGSFVFGPRDVPHTFIVSSDEARFLLVTHSAGSRASSARSGPPLPPRRSRPCRRRRPTWHRYCRAPPTTGSRSSALPAFRPELRGTNFAHAPESIQPAALDSDAWVEFLGVFIAGFRDLHLEVLDSSAGERAVAQRILFARTHAGPFRGLPRTGRKVQFSGLEINRMVDGRVGHKSVGEAAAHDPVIGTTRQTRRRAQCRDSSAARAASATAPAAARAGEAVAAPSGQRRTRSNRQ